jgi:hypothetical protein
MKIKDLYLSLFNALLVLSLLLPLDAFSNNVISLNNSASPSSEFEERSEEDVEENVLDLLPSSTFWFYSIKADHASFMHSCRVFDPSITASTPRLLSGWMMPLRV